MTPQAKPPSVGDSVQPVLDEAAVSICDDLLDEARNYGGPLKPEAREPLQALLADPSPTTWDFAHNIVLNVNPARTLLQAMRDVDPTCPPRGLGLFDKSVLEYLVTAEPDALYELTNKVPAAVRWSGYAPAPMLVLAAIRAVHGRGTPRG